MKTLNELSPYLPDAIIERLVEILAEMPPEDSALILRQVGEQFEVYRAADPAQQQQMFLVDAVLTLTRVHSRRASIECDELLGLGGTGLRH